MPRYLSWSKTGELRTALSGNCRSVSRRAMIVVWITSWNAAATRLTGYSAGGIFDSGELFRHRTRKRSSEAFARNYWCRNIAALKGQTGCRRLAYPDQDQSELLARQHSATSPAAGEIGNPCLQTKRAATSATITYEDNPLENSDEPEIPAAPVVPDGQHYLATAENRTGNREICGVYYRESVSVAGDSRPNIRSTPCRRSLFVSDVEGGDADSEDDGEGRCSSRRA